MTDRKVGHKSLTWRVALANLEERERCEAFVSLFDLGTVPDEGIQTGVSVTRKGEGLAGASHNENTEQNTENIVYTQRSLGVEFKTENVEKEPLGHPQNVHRFEMPLERVDSPFHEIEEPVPYKEMTTERWFQSRYESNIKVFKTKMSALEFRNSRLDILSGFEVEEPVSGAWTLFAYRSLHGDEWWRKNLPLLAYWVKIGPVADVDCVFVGQEMI